MAEKKNPSRAEQAVSDVKKKTSGSGKSSGKKPASANKQTNSKKTPSVKTEYEKTVIPADALIAVICLGLFMLFVIICIKPDGFLLRLIQSVILGLIGQAGFYFAIPACLYLFIIHVFARKKALRMRRACTIAFVFLCGILYHLAVQTQGMASGFDLVQDLYRSGTEGMSGGILCGGMALALRWACGNVVAYILSILGAALTLLGAMEITVPSIIRAVANRPREEFPEEEEPEYVEPAAVVVNHIANKQIEHKKKRREEALQAKSIPRIPEETHVIPQKTVRKKKVTSAAEEPVVSEEKSATPSRAANMMSTIDLDISAPMLPVKGKKSSGVESEKTGFSLPDSDEKEEPIPKSMPKLELDPEPPAFVAKKEPLPDKIAVEKPVAQKPKEEPKSAKVSAKEAAQSAQQVAQEIAQGQQNQQSMYCFPPIELLKRPLRSGADGTDEMRENSRRLNETLASFNIDAHIINVTRGPSVTRYEVELDKGVRLSKLTGCADDIALSLGASGVRIAAVPGKISVVGIEVPNRAVTTVSLREVIDSTEFTKAKSKSSIALGKSIEGTCVVGNISKMPHLLIAGTTGSGKSVCMNSIIISLLFKAGPDDVKLIMVDPKMVELGIYNGIPHLLIPVVTDPKKAAGSLQWAVTEMLRRYKMMSDLGVRDLESYNSIVTAEEDGQKLPQVVIIIDELADLMMVAAKEVEDSICRIAQMGRAAGMHLIIATQRPSANVITGLMKANIPSRIAFSVASAMESRIILDTMGAEKLVGKGDMLYAPIGSGKPLRVQGCFVTDSEVESVAGYVKEHYNAEYNQQILEEIEKKAKQAGKSSAAASDQEPNDDELEGDEMLPAAVDVILETGQASVSMLQRRLKLGYARAARIVDEMEEKGIVGPFQGSKPRSILITKEQWAQRNGVSSVQMNFDDYPQDPDALPEDVF